MLTLLISLAAAATPATLDTATWQDLGERNSSIGDVAVRKAQVDGTGCVEGRVTTDATTTQLLAVTRDMVRSSEWSSAKLAISEEVSRAGDQFVLFQYYDVPGWMLAADRFWVIEGTVAEHEAGGSYTWQRVEPSTEILGRAQQVSSWPIEPPVNYGQWTFTETDSGVDVRYRACADFGGRVPASLQHTINTRQVPALVADLVTEAKRQ